MSALQLLLHVSRDPWVEVRDGHAGARSIFDRHYSRRRYRDGREPKLFTGPGEKMVLVRPTLDALFIWRRFICDAEPPQDGVNCAVFRNESPLLSSDLIAAADARADRRWPGQRHYTFVDASRVRAKRDPGRCFLRAGWHRCGTTKGGLVILDRPGTAEPTDGGAP